jgi:cytochrome P450
MNAPVNIDHELLARSQPLDKLDVSDPALFRDDVWMPYFSRLRREDPVHWTAESMFGPHWSITKYNDIMQAELAHKTLSSDSSLGGISIRDRRKDLRLPMFIAMDPPQHDEQRKAVQPIVAPGNLAKLEHLIRERACRILDDLPPGRDLQLGGPGVRRADGADAGDPVRLSLRGPA